VDPHDQVAERYKDGRDSDAELSAEQPLETKEQRPGIAAGGSGNGWKLSVLK